MAEFLGTHYYENHLSKDVRWPLIRKEMVDLVYNSNKMKVQNTRGKPELPIFAQKAEFLGSYNTENLKS